VSRHLRRPTDRPPGGADVPSLPESDYTPLVEDRRPGYKVLRYSVWAVCGLVLLITGVGAASTFVGDPADGTTQVLSTSTPPSTTTRGSATVDSTESERTKAGPLAGPAVDARCWKSRDNAEAKWCQEAVATKTNFVPRYRTNQKSLAATHPEVKTSATGRGANSLARHGLLTCWLVSSPKYTLADVRSAFFLWFHRHPFSVPNDDTNAAADNVIAIAVQEICPQEATDLQDKGGPNTDLTAP
jgi:hypothetical protein